MLTILHGEDVLRSRERLNTILEKLKQDDSSVSITRLEAKTLTYADLETALGSRNLFGNQRVVVIEGLHSLQHSKKRTTLIKLVSNSSSEIILWEKRQLTASLLKKFPKAKSEIFKINKTLFHWIDSISPNLKTKKKQLQLLHKTLETEDPFFVMSMIARQLRLLIQAKERAPISAPPFVRAKLIKQSSLFSLNQLVLTHKKLLQIDLAHKTSGSVSTLTQELDMLVLKL